MLSLATVRDVVRRIHFTLGIVLSIPLVVLGVTGSILVLGSSGERATITPHARHTERSALAARAPEAILHAARLVVPDGYRPILYQAARRDAPARVVFSAPGPQAAAPGIVQVLVDPVHLTAVSTAARRDSLYVVAHDLHANLLEGATGRRVVGWLGVAMLLLGLTGPIAWWPGRSQLREGLVVRRDRGRFRVFRDLHRATGIWSLLFFLAVTVTGTFIVFPEPIGRAIASLLPARPLWTNNVPSVRRIPGVREIRMGDAIALAEKATGSDQLRSIGFSRGNQPMRIELANAVVVLVDPWTRRVVDIRDPRTYTVGERIISAMRPLHEGEIFGWPWRVILFCTGLLPLFFAATGLTMWVLKIRAARSAPIASPSRSAVSPSAGPGGSHPAR